MEKKRFLCYYHGVDNDGYFSGALVKYFLEVIHPMCEVELRPWTYSRDYPKMSKLLGYDGLYLVDLHWSNELQYELYKEYGSKFVWIDHHKSSIDDFEKFVEDNHLVKEAGSFGPKYIKLEGIQSCEYSACRNVWKYFTYLLSMYKVECPMVLRVCSSVHFKSIPERYGLNMFDKRIPLWLYFISTYDAWKRSEDREFWDNYLLNFETWAKSFFHNAEEAYDFIKWYETLIEKETVTAFKQFNEDKMNEFINKGQLLLEYQQDKDDRDCKIAGWTKTIVTDDGIELKAFLLNTQRRGSAIFKNIPNLETYDILIPFYMDKEKWNYSAYSFKEDIYIPGFCFKGVKFNGHPKAAGCQSKEFLFG